MKELDNVTKIDRSELMIGEGVGFERIRRITGYLVGTLDRFNNAKRAEEHDRVKHDAHSGVMQAPVQKQHAQDESRSA